MARRAGKRKSRRRGAAAVEMAILAPFLGLVLTGTVEVTRAIQVKDYLSDAARSGCRLAIQPGTTSSAVTDNVNAVLTLKGIAPADATITILVNGASADAKTAGAGDQISLKVSVPISKITWVPSFIFSSAAVDSETLVMMRQG